MIHPNGHDPSTVTIPAAAPCETEQAPLEMPAAIDETLDIATRAKLRARQQFQQNRFVIVGSGALIVALLIFVATSIPHKSRLQKAKVGSTSVKEESTQMGNAGADRSLFPITDSGRPSPKEAHEGFLNEKDLERSATRRSYPGSAQPAASSAPGTLGSIPPFGPDQQGWQPPPYQIAASASSVDGTDLGKAEREAMEKSSLIYARNISTAGVDAEAREGASITPAIGLGLSTGTRLRACLESAASTAVRAPVLAAVEYTYERDGQIVVPAGAKAVGHIQDADRSGYVRIQFDSLMMPDGAVVPIQA
ncbi:MAG: hypothetical protein WAK56_22185, partial [Candidatus Sulfotelmatobacter sp.]